MNKQPEALKLADDLVTLHGYPLSIKAASELRRLYEVNKELIEALTEIRDYYYASYEYQEMAGKVLAKVGGSNAT